MADNPQNNATPLTAAEAQLKAELQSKGIDMQNISNNLLREMIRLNREYNNRLRDINRELTESVDDYGSMVSLAGQLQEELRNIARRGSDAAKAVKSQEAFTKGTLGISKQLERSAEQLLFQKAELLRGELERKDIATDTAVSLTQELILGREQVKLEDQKAAIAEELNKARVDARTKELLYQRTGNQEYLNELQLIENKITELSTAETVIFRTLEQNQKNRKAVESTVHQYKDLNRQLLQVEAKTGIAGRILQGFSKIPVLGDLLDVKGAQRAMRVVAQSGATSFETMAAGARALGPALSAALGPIGVILLAAKAIQTIVEAMGEADKQVTNIARSLGVSKEEAANVRNRFFELGKVTQTLGATLSNQTILQKELVESAVKLAEITGTTVDLTKDLGEAVEKLITQFASQFKFLKLTEEEQKGLLALNMQTGVELSKIRETIFGTSRIYKLMNGYQFTERKVYGDILKTTNLVKLSIKGGLDALVQSTLQAQRFGGTLDESRRIASGFLDFENSIQKEMEAEVLLSRDLNFEKIRYAALTKDQVTVNEELNRIIAEAGGDIQSNAIAFEALAEATNMSEEQLANYIAKQKESETLRLSAAKLTSKEFEALAANTGLSIEARRSLEAQVRQGKLTGLQLFGILRDAGISAQAMTKIFDEQAVRAYGAQTAQEKFNDSLDKAKELFQKFVDGGYLDMLADAAISFSQAVLTVFGGSSAARRENEREATLLEQNAKQKLVQSGQSEQVYNEMYAKAYEEQNTFLNTLQYILLNPLTALSGDISKAVTEITSYQTAKAAEDVAMQLGAKPVGLAEGGFAKTGGIAQIDKGEAVLGANTRDTFIRTANTVFRQEQVLDVKLGEMKNYYRQLIQVQQQQVALLAAIKDKELTVQTDKLSYKTSQSTVMGYGNLLNSNVYLD